MQFYIGTKPQNTFELKWLGFQFINLIMYLNNVERYFNSKNFIFNVNKF